MGEAVARAPEDSELRGYRLVAELEQAEESRGDQQRREPARGKYRRQELDEGLDVPEHVGEETLALGVLDVARIDPAEGEEGGDDPQVQNSPQDVHAPVPATSVASRMKVDISYLEMRSDDSCVDIQS